MHNLTDEQLLLELERRFKENKMSLIQQQKLTSQLKDLNKRLEESEALKTHFISNITNEIINPFAAILGLSRSILDVKKENWQKAMSMVHLIHSEAFNLDFQLRNIFSAAKLEAGEWTPEIMNADINETIRTTLESFKYEAEKKQISIEYLFDVSPGIEKSFYYKTDTEKLRIILSNLVSNAIKFSKIQGEVIVRAWVEQEELYISVSDNGEGVSEENKKIIFDRFKRLDSGINSLNRGHGLGLSVNKALIDLLEGELTLESTPDELTVFTVRIPPGQVSDDSTGFAMDSNEFLFDDEDEQQVF